MFRQSLSLLAAALLLLPAFGAEWMDNFNAAKKKAQTEKKLILMDFTGSDWCGWCIRLRHDVLDKPEFEAYAKDKFILMEVDCPRKKQLSKKLQKQNQQLCGQYHISGFPTVLVVNADGAVVGGFNGYQKQEGVQAALDKAIRNNEAIKAAKKLPAAKQKAALNEVYLGMEKSVREAGGYKAEGESAAAKQREEINTKLQACKSAAEMKRVLTQAEPTLLPMNKRFFLDRKFTVMVNAAETVEDLAAARQVGDELIESLPAPYAAHIKAQIDRDFADPAAFLEKLKAARAAEQAK
ncbi:MAG: protein disulfide isomerase family protein [Akkermansia sp.]|nr:protein disulfide isomerase family protein [Akkermansia sp.]